MKYIFELYFIILDLKVNTNIFIKSDTDLDWIRCDTIQHFDIITPKYITSCKDITGPVLARFVFRIKQSL